MPREGKKQKQKRVWRSGTVGAREQGAGRGRPGQPRAYLPSIIGSGAPAGASDHSAQSLRFLVRPVGSDQTQIAAVVSPEELRLRRWSAEPGSGVAWRPGESNPVSGSLEAGKNQTTSPPVHPHHFVEFDKPSAITQPSRSILDHSSQDERSCKFAPSETHCLRAL